MRFLVIGDVVGRPGRLAVSKLLPDIRDEFSPDSVIINIENIAHGSGISPDTVNEAMSWKADCYTLGDHAWDNNKGIDLLNKKNLPIIRPANYPDGVPGRGWMVYSVGIFSVAVINLQGQVFFKNQPLSPFHELDRLLAIPEIKNANVRLVDFHAEATSEARGLGWHADGRISALWGTHTHVPTADAQILPQKTAYITDVGMAGLYHSIIGVDVSLPLKRFLTQIPARHTFDNTGPLELGGAIIDIDPSTKGATHIEHVRRIISQS